MHVPVFTGPCSSPVHMCCALFLAKPALILPYCAVLPWDRRECMGEILWGAIGGFLWETGRLCESVYGKLLMGDCGR